MFSRIIDLFSSFGIKEETKTTVSIRLNKEDEFKEYTIDSEFFDAIKHNKELEVIELKEVQTKKYGLLTTCLINILKGCSALIALPITLSVTIIKAIFGSKSKAKELYEDFVVVIFFTSFFISCIPLILLSLLL